MNIIEKIKDKFYQHKKRRIIKNCLKYGQIEDALILSKSQGFLNEELKIYDLMKEKRIIFGNVVERLEKLGMLKQSLEFAKLELPKRNIKTIERINHYLTSNDSKGISGKIDKNLEKTFWKELYFAKENDYSGINQIIMEYNWTGIEEMNNPLFTYANFANQTKN